MQTPNSNDDRESHNRHSIHSHYLNHNLKHKQCYDHYHYHKRHGYDNRRTSYEHHHKSPTPSQSSHRKERRVHHHYHHHHHHRSSQHAHDHNHHLKNHRRSRSGSHSRSKSLQKHKIKRPKSRSSLHSESPVSHSSSLTSQNECTTACKVLELPLVKLDLERVSDTDASDDELNVGTHESKSKIQLDPKRVPKLETSHEEVLKRNQTIAETTQIREKVFDAFLEKPQEMKINVKTEATLSAYDMLDFSFIQKNTFNLEQTPQNENDLERRAAQQESENEVLRRSSRLSMKKNESTRVKTHAAPLQIPKTTSKLTSIHNTEAYSLFESLDENLYLCKKHRNKDTKRMQCDCGLYESSTGCGVECLNRMLMIECGSKCALGNSCTNKCFQMKNYAPIEPFKTESKGWGLRAFDDIQANRFIIEYIGEVLNLREFKKRCERYSKSKNKHFYFMALKSDQIIDATRKGNIARFFNHSCNPNCETQKWTVNGELRIGFFARRHIAKNEELTFDYQFQTIGEEQQKCYCGSDNCRGVLGQKSETNQTYDQLWTSESEDDSDSESALVKKHKKNRDDADFEKDFNEIKSLNSRDNVLKLCRLMVHAENLENRMSILRIILKTRQDLFLKLFIDYHGLKLLWSWMIDVDRLNDLKHLTLKIAILDVLSVMPIKNRTLVEESKLLSTVKRWSENTFSYRLTFTDASNENSSLEVVDAILSWVETNMDAEIERQNLSKKSIDLFKKWNNLALAFKIPKKQRIEDRREHERQVNDTSVSLEIHHQTNYFDDYNRKNSFARAITNKTRAKYFENRYNTSRKLSKEERRRLFEQRILENEKREQQMEEERRRHEAQEKEEERLRQEIPEQPCQDVSNLSELSKRISSLFPTHSSINTQPNRTLVSMDISSPSPLPTFAQPKEQKKKKHPKLPPNWIMSKNRKGKVFYYHKKTKKSQWHFPREKTKHTKPKEQKIDTKNLTDEMKKQREIFREELSKVVCKLLKPYLRNDCKIGHIANNDDFKHLARKFTHSIMTHEIERALERVQELSVNKRVKIKTQEYVTKYMLKFNGDYSRKTDSS